MSTGKKKPEEKTKGVDTRIAENRKARHEYFIEERYEAGLALTGWEVKSLRAGRGRRTRPPAAVRSTASCAGCATTGKPSPLT